MRDLRDRAFSARTHCTVAEIERWAARDAAPTIESREYQDRLVELVKRVSEPREHVCLPELGGDHSLFELARIELAICLIEHVPKMTNELFAPP